MSVQWRSTTRTDWVGSMNVTGMTVVKMTLDDQTKCSTCAMSTD